MNKPPHTTLVEVVVQENPHQNTKQEDQGRVKEVKVDVSDPGPHDPLTQETNLLASSFTMALARLSRTV